MAKIKALIVGGIKYLYDRISVATGSDEVILKKMPSIYVLREGRKVAGMQTAIYNNYKFMGNVTYVSGLVRYSPLSEPH